MLALPTWDLIITLGFITTVVAGLLLGRDRISVVLISIYVGMAVGSELGNWAYDIFSGSQLLGGHIWIKSNLSIFMIKTIVFLAIVVGLTIWGEHTVNPEVATRGLISTIITGIYGFLIGGLLVSTLIYFLAPISRESLFINSALAKRVMDFRNWWLLLPLLIMIVTGFRRGKPAA